MKKEDILKVIEDNIDALYRRDDGVIVFSKGSILIYINKDHLTLSGEVYRITEEQHENIYNLSKKALSEELKMFTKNKDIQDAVKQSKLLPLEFSTNDHNKILVVDVNHLPSEYKNKSLEDIKEMLLEEYGHKVFLIDNSRANLQGSQPFNTTPVYIIG